MKNLLKVSLLAFIGMIFFASCAKEQMEDLISNETHQEETTNDATNSTNSRNITNALVNGDEEDGKIDCFTLAYPLTITYNGENTTVNSDEELGQYYEDWFNSNGEGDEDNFPMIIFPINVTLEDGTTQEVTEEELEELFIECYGDDWEDDCDSHDDDDEFYEECFELLYPINIVFPDGTTVTANNEEEFDNTFYEWFENNGDTADSTGYPTIAFPISIQLEDGTIQEINSEEEIEAIFEECYDFDDEDYEECFEFNYPLTIVYPDESTETVADDEALWTAIENYYDTNPDTEADPTLAFPIEVTLEDGTVQTVNSEEELEAIFEDCYEELGGTMTTGLRYKKFQSSIAQKLLSK